MILFGLGSGLNLCEIPRFASSFSLSECYASLGFPALCDSVLVAIYGFPLPLGRGVHAPTLLAYRGRKPFCRSSLECARG